jgi:phosphate transport system protein
MPLKLFTGEGADRLRSVEEKIQRMLADDRHAFDLAMGALLGSTLPAEVRRELKATDRRVNEGEREIRRELVVHASVFQGIATPTVLVYMSIVKDIERVGDYAKNLLDLSRDGANFGTLPDAAEWEALSAEVAGYITRSAEAFGSRDVEGARELLRRGDELLDYFDKRVSALVKGKDTGPQPIARALALRYLKRVVAHLTNLLSAVVMPVDRLDHFDEDPEDRG